MKKQIYKNKIFNISDKEIIKKVKYKIKNSPKENKSFYLIELF